jgi:hypothetical protein
VYEVIGHHDVRSLLQSHDGSFGLLGPSGVGKRGIVAEWLAGRPAEPFSGLKQALWRPDIIYLLDGDRVHDWSRFQLPLEENRFTLLVVASGALPNSIWSRIPCYHTGLLTEVEVTQVLARSFPNLGPRPILARIAQGTLHDIEFKAEVAKTFETLDKALAEGHLPDLRKHRPVAVYSMLLWAARAVLELPSLTFSTAARAFLTRNTALELLTLRPPEDDFQARNMLSLIFSRSARG